MTYSHDFPWHSAAVLASAGGVWLGFVYMALRLHAADVALKNAHRRFGEERMTALRRCYGVLQKKARKQVRQVVEVANRRLGSEVFRYDGDKLTWENEPQGIEVADEAPAAAVAPQPPAADEPTFADDAEAAIEAALPEPDTEVAAAAVPLPCPKCKGTELKCRNLFPCCRKCGFGRLVGDWNNKCPLVKPRTDAEQLALWNKHMGVAEVAEEAPSNARGIGWFSAWCKIAFDRQWGWRHGWKAEDDTSFWFQPGYSDIDSRIEANDPLTVAHAAQAALRDRGVVLTHDPSLEQPRSWLCPNVDCPHVDTKDYILDFVKKCNICPVCREETKWVDWGSVSGEGDESGWVFMDETDGDLLAARSLTDRWWSRSKKDAAVLDRSEARDEMSKAASRYHYLVPAHTFVAHRVNASPATASAAEEAL